MSGSFETSMDITTSCDIVTQTSLGFCLFFNIALVLVAEFCIGFVY